MSSIKSGERVLDVYRDRGQSFRTGLTDSEAVSHSERPLSELPRYPDLETVYRTWQRRRDDGVDSEIEMFDVPPALLPTVMLIDLAEDGTDATIRLAGTFCCELYGGELRGKSVHDFFKAGDARLVLKALYECAASGMPSLAERRYVCLEGDDWGYTRLLLPQPPRHGKRRLFKAMDRSTLYHLGAVF